MPNLVDSVTVGGVLAFILTLVRIAIGTERRRADDWRTSAAMTKAANDVLQGSVERLADSQREMAASTREMATSVRDLLAYVQAKDRSAA